MAVNKKGVIMVELKVGDRVKITPTVTTCPWEGQLAGKILIIDNDGIAAVEMEGDKLGHRCMVGGYGLKAENGWWFMREELELIK